MRRLIMKNDHVAEFLKCYSRLWVDEMTLFIKYAWLHVVRKTRLISALALLSSCCETIHADDWPQWRGLNRDGIWNEPGILETFPANELNVLWRVPVGIGFSSPVIVGGRVFVTDSELTRPKAHERVHAFDAKSGEKLWSYPYEVNYPETGFSDAYPAGPIATPIVADGRVYSLGNVGDVVCLEALKGALVWQKNLVTEFPGSELSASPSPVIEGDLLILLVGAKPAANVIALNKNTGELAWKAIDEGPTASSPIVVTAAGVRQLIVWTDRSVTALAPATGETLWREPLNTTQDAAVSTPVHHDGFLLIGGLMMKLDQGKPGAVVLWPESRATAKRVLSDTSTALFRDDYVYSARSFGEFVCLDAKTGVKIWETDKITGHKSGASVHITENGESVLLYNDHGELIRAQLTRDGYHEISRARVLEPVQTWNRKVAWAAPAFANGNIFARTNKELVCASLSAK
jgi:outer membrane protein assembly factor BamB